MSARTFHAGVATRQKANAAAVAAGHQLAAIGRGVGDFFIGFVRGDDAAAPKRTVKRTAKPAAKKPVAKRTAKPAAKKPVAKTAAKKPVAKPVARRTK